MNQDTLDGLPHRDMAMSGPWITAHEEAAVLEALRHGWYGAEAYGFVERFEQAFASHHDRAHGLMTPNCTSALHLVLAGLGIGPGDEVILPECTWIASSAPVSYVGATPVFADIDPVTWCLDPQSVARHLTPRTRAIIAVDLYGNMADWPALTRLADAAGIPVIEDAAEALGSRLLGRPAGKFGVASVFSFHRTKTLTTGEGGMLLVDDDHLAQRCRLLRDHGRAPGAWYNTEVAFKYMPFNLQAALGYAQFQRLNELVGRKRTLLAGYRQRLGDLSGLTLNTEPPKGVNGAWCTTVVWDAAKAPGKDEVLARLNAQGVPARPFFFPLSSLPAYASHPQAGSRENAVAYDIADRGICLPSALNLNEDDLDYACSAFRDLLR